MATGGSLLRGDRISQEYIWDRIILQRALQLFFKRVIVAWLV
jgi:hypothetical protein